MTNYTVNNMNAYTNVVQNASTNYTYDANGNLLSDGTRIFFYDIENRLTMVNDGATSNYLYDALGRRIKKETSADTINYYFDGLQVIEERNSLDSLLASYVWGTWLDDIVSMKRNGNNYYYHPNILGSVIAITDSIGNVAERYEYDVFGKAFFYSGDYTALTTSAIGNTYMFTGREYDLETGNYYYRARYYNPDHGRFLQKDPLGFSGGDNNLYTYAKSNPLFYCDPLGLASINDPYGSEGYPLFLPPPPNKRFCQFQKPKEDKTYYDYVFKTNTYGIQPITTSLDLWSETFDAFGKNGRKIIRREIWEITGVGPGKLANSWNQSVQTAGKLGKVLGVVGFVTSTAEYANNIHNSTITTGKHANYWIGIGLIAASVAFPVIAPVAITYGAVQVISALTLAGSLEEYYIDQKNHNPQNNFQLHY